MADGPVIVHGESCRCPVLPVTLILPFAHASVAALGEGMEIVSFGVDRTLEEVLDEGVERLQNKSTWKLWTWVPDNDEFYEAEAFRSFVLVRSSSRGTGAFNCREVTWGCDQGMGLHGSLSWQIDTL